MSFFLSYRPSDSSAARLRDRLTQRFSGERIFRDADDVPLGASVPAHLRQAIDAADAVLVVIGPSWATATDEHGRRRLDDPADVVRIGVETALRSEAPVIPILVAGAEMPDAGALPESMRSLTTRRGVAIRPGPEFDGDVDRLAAGIEKLGPARRQRERARSLEPDAITALPMPLSAEGEAPARQPDARQPDARQPDARQPDARSLDWDREDELIRSIRKDEEAAEDAAENAQRWTGALGVSSFVLAIASGSLMIATFVATGLLVRRNRGPLDPRQSMLIGAVFLVLLGLSCLGAVLGSIGLFGRFRMKALAGVGLGINALLVFGFIALVVVSALARR